ncbi:VOC family protein [Algoriphagus sediminis]|uniref:VOC family protein n=1 Tax=Algoriphagus sediminis TaxID=3057113 RepID=A0ABT7YDB4_9BACT|nr:VOC family protein [Algoriphagus sediminis]MDN3204496.1 VOC family protein [Algoriphagus sediminis]
MKKAKINGIQQVGIGVKDANEAWTWYRKAFKMDVPIFQDSAEATLMTRYTSNRVESRHAILAMNMQGGGGFEIWQYTSKKPVAAKTKPTWKDLGILAVKIRCRDIDKTYKHLENLDAKLLSKPKKNPLGVAHFYVEDPFGNLFEIEENSSWFSKNKDFTGGVSGVVIGVTSVDSTIPIIRDHFQQSETLLDQTEIWPDFECFESGKSPYRRVILAGNSVPSGAFGKLLCRTTIELIETDQPDRKQVFAERNWGDLGFIHVCFDVNNMSDLKSSLKKSGVHFTVDSENEFDMGNAAGRFSYLEDPDGTLIEMVETFKIPILEKWGWFLDLTKRDSSKTLSNFMVKMLSLNRVKD